MIRQKYQLKHTSYNIAATTPPVKGKVTKKRRDLPMFLPKSGTFGMKNDCIKIYLYTIPKSGILQKTGEESAKNIGEGAAAYCSGSLPYVQKVCLLDQP